MEVISLISLLGICSLEDIWKRQIHLIIIGLFGILGVILHLYYGKQSALDMCAGVFVGVVLYLVSIGSGEKIGKGDAFLVTSTGVYLGFWNNITILWMASIMAAIVGMIAYFVFHKGKQFRLPFAPFLLVAYLLFLLFTAWEGAGT